MACQEEFAARPAAVLTPEEIVKLAYQRVLQRLPDPGAAGWVNFVKQGTTYRQLVKYITINELREFKNAIPTTTPDDAVSFLYCRLLNRAYGAGEDHGLWTQTLQSSGIDAVIDGILGSQEFADKSPNVTISQPGPVVSPGPNCQWETVMVYDFGTGEWIEHTEFVCHH